MGDVGEEGGGVGGNGVGKELLSIGDGDPKLEGHEDCGKERGKVGGQKRAKNTAPCGADANGA